MTQHTAGTVAAHASDWPERLAPRRTAIAAFDALYYVGPQQLGDRADARLTAHLDSAWNAAVDTIRDRTGTVDREAVARLALTIVTEHQNGIAA